MDGRTAGIPKSMKYTQTSNCASFFAALMIDAHVSALYGKAYTPRRSHELCECSVASQISNTPATSHALCSSVTKSLIATMQAPAMCYRAIATVQAPAMCHCQKLSRAGWLSY